MTAFVIIKIIIELKSTSDKYINSFNFCNFVDKINILIYVQAKFF
jgi:hypothetical protein